MLIFQSLKILFRYISYASQETETKQIKGQETNKEQEIQREKEEGVAIVSELDMEDLAMGGRATGEVDLDGDGGVDVLPLGVVDDEWYHRLEQCLRCFHGPNLHITICDSKWLPIIL